MSSSAFSLFLIHMPFAWTWDMAANRQHQSAHRSYPGGARTYGYVQVEMKTALSIWGCFWCSMHAYPHSNAMYIVEVSHRMVCFMNFNPSSDSCSFTITSRPNTLSRAREIATRPTLPGTILYRSRSTMRYGDFRVCLVGDGGGWDGGCSGGWKEGWRQLDPG